MASEYERQTREDRKEAELVDKGASGAVAFKQLRAPVGTRWGSQVTNHVSDQRTVMSMLDNLRTSFGGNRRGNGSLEVVWPIPAEGRCHSILAAMILRVQKEFYALGELGFRPDGAIDPGGRTFNLIIKYSGHIPIFPVSDPKSIALRAVPLALTWVEGASNYLQRYKSWRSSGRTFGLDPVAANTHLHLDTLDDIQSHSRINEWIENYRMISETLCDAENVFVRASREEALTARAWMDCWGQFIPAWALPKSNTPPGKIWFGPDFLGLGPNCKAAILVHEAGHYIKPKIGHQGGERGSEYDRQSADQALTSAYVCANFAAHASTGRDERFGLARPSE